MNRPVHRALRVLRGPCHAIRTRVATRGLLLSGALLFLSCGDDGTRGPGGTGDGGATAGDPEVWVVERPGSRLPQDELPLRQSLGNISRPFARSPVFEVTLRPGPGAFVEFELGYRGETAHPTPPDEVGVRVKTPGGSTSLPLESLGTDGGATPWHRYRADLSAAPEGAAQLVVHVRDEVTPPAGEGWRVSLPRLYQDRNTAARPNVLFITVDTLRADYLGVYGHDRETSPRIDQFAKTATVFGRAISQGSWTLPSYSSMFTALYPESHGVVHRPHRLAGKFVSVAEVFADAGYTTGAFVTGTFTDSEWGFDQGFDQYDDFGMVTDDDGPAVADPTASESMKRAEQRVTSPEVTDKAAQWLDANGDRSFFLMVHYFDPHSDLVEHEGFTERFPARPAEFRLQLVPGEIPPEVAGQRALYEGEVAFTDHHIGRLLDHLERSGLAENTVVVLSADHGEEYFERTRVGHGHALFDELLRVPLMVRAPGVKPSRVSAPVANVDVLPTLAELCDLDYTAPGQGGESLASLMKGEDQVRRNPVLSVRFPVAARDGVSRAPWTQYRVDQGDLSYIWWKQGNQIIHFLFDSKADPEHRVNLAPERGHDVQRFQEYRTRVLPVLERIRQDPQSVDDFEGLTDALEGLGYVGDHEEIEIDDGAGSDDGE